MELLGYFLMILAIFNKGWGPPPPGWLVWPRVGEGVPPSPPWDWFGWSDWLAWPQ